MFLFTVLAAVWIVANSDESCPEVEIVSRKEWLAKDPFRVVQVKLPLNHVVILHTVTHFCVSKPQCMRGVQFIQDLHIDERGWFDIAYNFLVGGEGRIYEGRGWRSRGAFSINFNANSLGIAFIGNYNNYPPNQAQVNATLNLLKCGIEKGYLAPTLEIHGHRDVACTQSPGDKLYNTIRQWDRYKGGRLPLFNCKPLEPPVIDDGQLEY